MADFVVERRNVDFHVVAETFTKYVFYLNLTVLVGIIYCASQCDKVLYKNHGFSIEICVKAFFGAWHFLLKCIVNVTHIKFFDMLNNNFLASPLVEGRDKHV